MSDCKIKSDRNERKEYRSLDEYRREFFPNKARVRLLTAPNPRELGQKLARELAAEVRKSLGIK